MRQAGNDAVLYGRFTIAYAIILAGYGLAKLATRLLPKNHPSRIYANGRLDTGKDRLKAALRPRSND